MQMVMMSAPGASMSAVRLDASESPANLFLNFGPNSPRYYPHPHLFPSKANTRH